MSLAYFAFAVLLLQLAANRFDAANTAQIVGCLFIASGVPPLILTRGRDWSAWVEFFLIGGLVLAWSFF